MASKEPSQSGSANRQVDGININYVQNINREPYGPFFTQSFVAVVPSGTNQTETKVLGQINSEIVQSYDDFKRSEDQKWQKILSEGLPTESEYRVLNFEKLNLSVRECRPQA